MIVTYYSPVDKIDESEQRALISFFKSQWNDVRQLALQTAKEHPRFKEMESILAAYPEVTPAGYRDQCFFRWLAFDQMQYRGPILILDYDVFSVLQRPLQWFIDRYQRPTVLDHTNPCAVFLPDATFLKNIVDMLFLPTVPNQEPSGAHIGDNTVFGEHWRTIGDCDDIVATYPDTHTGLIHFANQFCPHDKHKIVVDTIQTLQHISKRVF